MIDLDRMFVFAREKGVEFHEGASDEQHDAFASSILYAMFYVRKNGELNVFEKAAYERIDEVYGDEEASPEKPRCGFDMACGLIEGVIYGQ